MGARIFFGALLLAALAGVYLLDTAVLRGAWLTRGLIWLLALGMLREILLLARPKVDGAPGLFLMGAVALVIVALFPMLEGEPVPGAMLAAGILIAGGARLLGMAPLRGAPVAFPEAAALAGALALAGGCLSFLDRLAVESVASAFAVVAISKTNDICAYFVGTLVGRVRIVPSISPKKTWEGTIAGVLGAAGVAALLARPLTGQDMPGPYAAVIGAVLGAASFLGDLIASGIKRWAGVKDSASLLPGFGGILDMLDGLLLAAPVAVLCIHGT
ncbi:MAG: phosphatidate cytidylyltransferase [Planctomycetaceae bacterium]